MRKCQQCRHKDVELLTRWERFKAWLFEKVNHTFFADDFEDLKTQKYTQGFSDGTADGAKYERLRMEKDRALYEVPQTSASDEEIDKRFNDLFSNADLHKIVALDKSKGMVYIGGEKADAGRLTNLKSEAEALVNFELWGLLQETPKELAQKAMFVEGNDLTQMQKGRTILYTLSTQRNIIEILKNYNG